MIDKTTEERLEIRKNDSQPVLDDFLVWLKEQKEVVAPKTATGTAISYTLKKRPKLRTFMKDGRIEIDNNRAERSIKPFVIGRNYVFKRIIEKTGFLQFPLEVLLQVQSPIVS